MNMNVDEVLSEWGARKLEERVVSWIGGGVEPPYIDRETVTVSFETISDGYCETCYYEYEGCRITGRDTKGNSYAQDFDFQFGDALAELLEIGLTP